MSGIRKVANARNYRVVKKKNKIKKTTPNFGGHFYILPEKVYNLLLDAIKVGLFDISCEKMNDIAFILFTI